MPIELVDGHVLGLRVRIHPSGKRTWSLNIRDAKGSRRRFNVGTGLGLAEARRRGEELRRSVGEGADPTTERRDGRYRAQAARAGVGTLTAILDAYFLGGPGQGLRRATESHQMVRAVFSSLLEKPAIDISRAELQRTADAWRSPASASLAVRILRPCLKWAERREQVQKGASDLETIVAVRKRDRVLTPEEIKAIWPQLRGAHGNVIRWLMWTGCRLNEAAGMTWGEISGDIWTIPAMRAKNRRSRGIPLPRQAVAMISDNGAPGALVFGSKRGGQLSNWDRETKRLQAASRTANWHRHDFRRTVATTLGDLGFAPHVVSVVLGHAHIADGTTAIYARSRYEREHREALQALAEEIDRILISDNNVLQLAPHNCSAQRRLT
jgi:integrase